MKIFRCIAFLVAIAGTVAYQARQRPIYAAAANPSADPAASAHPATATGAAVYQRECAQCHGEKMEGIAPAFPSLTGVGTQMKGDQLTQLIEHGRGRMPAFSTTQLSPADLTSLLRFLAADRTFNEPLSESAAAARGGATANSAGGALFQQNCAFCHGRDAAGGETGPDLTRSKLVLVDVAGDQIVPVVRNGRAEGKMPKFNLGDAELVDLVKFIHDQARLAAEHPGGRRGVDVADLQTGNVAAGKAYFNGPGKCSTCHSPTGDLAGVASRYQGLQLEERMLYPNGVKDTLTVTLPSGGTITGPLEYQDEFTIGLRDTSGVYHSWPTNGVKYTIDSPVTAHVDQFPKYTDDDIHNLMAYIQTLK